MSETTMRALTILRDYPGINPREFARKMWPDSPGWKKHIRVGGGSLRDGGMQLAGGSYLGKLRKRGLADQRFSPSSQGMWYLTPAARQLLKDTAP